MKVRASISHRHRWYRNIISASYALAKGLSLVSAINKCPSTVLVFLLKLINTLTDEAVYRRHEISSVMSDFRQCPWEIGSAPAERAGQGEVGGCTRRVQTAWRCLGLALKSPWFAQMG